jgi:hypothetical protein
MTQFENLPADQARTIEWIVTGREFSNLVAVHFHRVQMLDSVAIVQLDWELAANENGRAKGIDGWVYKEVIAVRADGAMNTLSVMRIERFLDGRQEVETATEVVLPDNSCFE